MSVDTETIQLRKARPGDAGALARISKRAFDYDVHYGAPGPGGPPGYDSDGWQSRMIKLGDYYRILAGGMLIGGIIIFRKKPREYELVRIFIDPDHQNRGVGTRVLELLGEEYPLAKKWSLDTPDWNQRTRRFYEKSGFVVVGIDRRGLVYFQKVIAGSAPGFD